MFQLIGDRRRAGRTVPRTRSSGLRSDRADDRHQLGGRTSDGPHQQYRRHCRAGRRDGVDRATRGEHPPRPVGLVRFARSWRRPAGGIPGTVPGGGAHGFLRACTVSTRPERWPKRRTSLAAALPGRSSRHSPPPDWPAAYSCSCGILAVSDPSHPELGRISGGLPFLVKDVLGPRLGVFLLVGVIFAVFVCALAVHAGSVRLMFAMARDNNLPFAHSLRTCKRGQRPRSFLPWWSASWPRRYWS